MPLLPALCQYIFSAECGWCTPIVPASRGQNQRITPKFEFSQMCACSPHQGCRARLGLQEPKPSDKDNQSLTPPKQVLPQLTDMELKSHSATCTSTLYPFYFNLGSFKYVYSSFTFPSTLLFSPMQWNLWLMC